MMHSVSAAVRQRTISLSSSLHHRNVEQSSTPILYTKRLVRVASCTLPLKLTQRSSITSYKSVRGSTLIPSAQGGNGGTPPPSPEEENDPNRRELNLLLSLIVQYPAVRGSIAVALGYWAHIDPWGTFRWDSDAIVIGCALAIIPSLMDMLIWLPNWEPQRTTRTMKLKMPRDVAEKLSKGGNLKILEPTSSSSTTTAATTGVTEEEHSTEGIATSTDSTTQSLLHAVISMDAESTIGADTKASTATLTASSDDPSNINQEQQQQKQVIPDMVDVERQMVVRVDQHPLRDALQSLQMSRVVSNIGRSLSPPSEALLLFLVHVSEEMLYRGVILVLAVRWCTDNLYYAGVEESLVLPGGLELAPPQLGAILGGIGLTVGAVGLLVQRELFPLRLLDATKEQLQSFVEDRKQGDKKSAEDATKLETKKKVVAGLLERLRSGVVIQQRWIVAVEATVEFLQWSTLSTSFLFTGNILAPIAGSMVNDTIYSACQRLKNREIKEAMKERAESASERAKQTANLLLAVREHRKSRLEPPKGGAVAGKRKKDEALVDEKDDPEDTKNEPEDN
jgi:hypothetical protein